MSNLTITTPEQAEFKRCYYQITDALHALADLGLGSRFEASVRTAMHAMDGVKVDATAVLKNWD